MPVSANGWPVIESYGPPALVPNPAVPGTSVRVLGGLRAGPVATILLWVASQFDKRIADLDEGDDDWGYNYRPIRGQTSGFSNHASGTAMDCNAVQFPIGVRAMSAWQRQECRAIAAEAGVVTWGGDWGRPDEMHFEINTTDEAAIEAAAARLAQGGVTPGKGEFDDMKFLVIPTSWQVDGKDAAKPVFLVDGLFARWVRNPQELAAVKKRLEVAGLDTAVNPSGDVTQYFSILVGPEPAGTPAAWGRLSGKEAA